MDQPPQANRRKYLRVRTGAVVLLRRIEGRTQLARGVDLGIGGIRFQCVGQDLELGEWIAAKLILGDDTVVVVGKVVHVTNVGRRQEVALAFERVIDPETLERLCERGQADESEGIPGSGNGDAVKSARSGPDGGQDE